MVRLTASAVLHVVLDVLLELLQGAFGAMGVEGFEVYLLPFESGFALGDARMSALVISVAPLTNLIF